MTDVSAGSHRTPDGTLRGAAAAMVRLVPVGLLLLVAACSTPGPSGGPGASAAAPGKAASRGGGYYLDDGPGGAPPVDPMSVPDAIPRAEPLNQRNARPYVALGKRYEPMSELVPYRARGIASWYGKRYHGRKTANGESYDMYAMSGAHPTLPIPSYVRVTHLDNGRSVIVRINDRGPFLHDRLIDLSYTAAARLGYLNAGSAPVEVELITRFDEAALVAGDSRLPPPAEGLAASQEQLSLSMQPVQPVQPPDPTGSPGGVVATSGVGPAALPSAAMPVMPVMPVMPAAASAGKVYLQLGAYGSRSAAQSAAERMQRELGGLLRAIEVRQEGSLFKLHTGPYAGRSEALGAAQRIAQASTLKPFTVTR
jgi:rare lipoprotein A